VETAIRYRLGRPHDAGQMCGLKPVVQEQGALASFFVHCSYFLYFVGTVLIFWLVFRNPKALA
jgi:hypothetical protein